MRFVWAVVAFVLAAVMIGAGIAQRTIFQGPKTESLQLEVDQEAPYTLIDGAVLGRLPGTQTLRVQGEGTIFASYGRTPDLTAWLSDTLYNRITLDDEGLAVSTAVEPEIVEPEAPATDAEESTPAPEETTAPEGETDETATEDPARSPVGSDLWLDEFEQEDLLVAPLQLPETMSVLVASDGTLPAPARITVTWPIENSTPWAGPLIVVGGIIMAVGIYFYFLGIRHVRRSRGPRRKGLPMPVTEPIDLAVEGADKGVISASPTRKSISGRRTFVVVPAVAVSALLFAGCSADAWPVLGPTPTPSPTQTVISPEGQQQPAVTEAQAERIITRISETVAEADEALDATLAATRIEGSVLAERTTNYTLRGAIPEYAAPAAIPTKPLDIVLPQAYDAWPRVVMAVATDDATKTASIMYLTQQDQWSEYKLTFLSNLEASTLLPDTAPPYIGAPRIAPDSPFLLLAPDQVAAAYSDILNKGEESESYALFEAEDDQFRAIVAADREARLAEFNTTGASTGSLAFSSAAGTDTPLALGTVESGAIVAVNLTETDTVKPTNADAVIKLTNNATVKTLSGVEQSASGFTSTFNDQLFFYVPAQGSSEKIRLLGYSSTILNAQVIK